LCDVSIVDDKAKVSLSKSIYGLAKGQIAVFYDDDRLVGSGVIV